MERVFDPVMSSRRPTLKEAMSSDKAEAERKRVHSALPRSVRIEPSEWEEGARELYALSTSKCCGARSLLVWARDGGYVTQGCSKCGKAKSLAPEEIPAIVCDRCQSIMGTTIDGHKNYHGVCSCGHGFPLCQILPQHYFVFSAGPGVAAPGDPSWM